MTNISLMVALAKIEQAFGIDKVLKDFDRDFTVRYYTQSEYGYRRFHSKQGCVHLALNETDVFSPEGYYTQPRLVETYLRQRQAQQVLELGCGKGFNSLFLAERNPNTQFVGIDLTPLHVKIAQQAAKPWPNLSFQQGDFNQLPFADGQFALVFAVECLCHSTDPVQTLSEIYRVLQPGGCLVVFDGYRDANYQELSAELQTVQQLTEVAMAVQGGMADWDEWLTAAHQAGLALVEKVDRSAATMPTLQRLQALSLRYFGLRGKWLKRLVLQFRQYMVRNAIAALLLPICITEGTFHYYQLVLERPYDRPN